MVLEYIRVHDRILDVGKGIITKFSSHNMAKKYGRQLQTKGLGRGQLKLMEKFPRGDYTQIEFEK